MTAVLSTAAPMALPASRPALDIAPQSGAELVASTQFLAREVRAGAHIVDFDPIRAGIGVSTVTVGF